ncbi:hypothetical protein [Natronosalvus halobius]|uniref:hypothetical protein n=1 Tax=Natronosalvus halobius TaxID=2953746 RepID=UPI00209CD1CD|nr:hypothetical protein [Natronosalvus halobius]USZ71735.1 hypothetical protein NGM15_00045 [Natronosalvus halobius]
MNLDELRTVQSKERQKDSLQHLRPSFYKEVGEYIANLEAERERVAEAADDPFSSPEVGRLTDEIETAKDVVEAVYERRMGKLVKQASLAAAGMPANDEGLTAEESDLFTDLVDRIQGNKQRVLDVLDGNEAEAEDAVAETTASSESTVPDPSADPGDALADVAGSATDESAVDPSSEGSVSAADAMGGDLPASDDVDAAEAAEAGAASGPRVGDTDDVPPPPPDEPPANREDAGDAESDAETTGGEDSSDLAPDIDRVTVRITRDVGSILGIDDREYTLATDDVVTLPEQNATPLVEREAAEPLE